MAERQPRPRPAPGTVAAVPIDDLRTLPTERNPRRSHRVGAVVASIRAHGFAQPVTANANTGHVLAGNGRLAALRRMRAADEPPPDGITVDERGRWCAPTLWGAWPEEDEPRIALALNGGLSGGLEGETDRAIIAAILEGIPETDLASLGATVTAADQAIRDGLTAPPPPVVNLDGLETVARAGASFAERVVNLSLPVETATRLKAASAAGIPVASIVAAGLDAMEVSA